MPFVRKILNKGKNKFHFLPILENVPHKTKLEREKVAIEAEFSQSFGECETEGACSQLLALHGGAEPAQVALVGHVVCIEMTTSDRQVLHRGHDAFKIAPASGTLSKGLHKPLQTVLYSHESIWDKSSFLGFFACLFS